MSETEQPYQQIGIQSNSGGDINIEQSQVNIAKEIHIHAPRSAQEKKHTKNRKTMLDRVELIWITDFLKESLYNQVLIPLGLHERPDAVTNPWRPILQELNQQERPLPPTMHIIHAYDKANGTLLILGEPGSGKTTLLLELLCDLLARARSDDTHPIPVIFNLSTWALKRQPLADWLVEELYRRYEVPRLLAQEWMASDQVLPLLDGLDEIAFPHRTACVEAINSYHLERGLVPLVVCSRSAEYIAVSSYLQLRTAVTVQPLTTTQIDTYLSQDAEKLAAVAVALHEDPILQELATTPLMLNILIVAYAGKAALDLLMEGSLEERRQAIFAAYIERMLHRGSYVPQYPAQRTIQQLAWLAWQMKRYEQTIFYIEGLQADWLSARWARLVYHVSIGLIFGVVVGLVFGAIVGLIVGLGVGLKGGLIFGVLVGFFGGLGVGLRGGPDSSIQPTESIAWSFESFRSSFLFRLRRGLRERLIGSLIFGVVVGLIGGLILGKSVGLGVGLGGGMIIGVIVWLIGVLRGGSDPSTRSTGGITWSFESFRAGFLFALGGGLIGGLRGGLIGGLTSKMLVDKRSTPNQGIWRSARYAVITALIFGLVFGLIFGLIGALIFGPSEALTFFLSGVLSSALSSALIFGGDACTKHLILRLLLWQSGTVPWSYPHFLDFVAKRILLRKLGGGYIFIHRLLLEHFATLYQEYLCP